MQFKLSEVKDLLVEIYNNPEVPAIDIPKTINEKLSEQYAQEVKLPKELILKAYETLKLEFKHRPRKNKGTDSIIFEVEEIPTTPTVVTNNVVGDIPVTPQIEF